MAGSPLNPGTVDWSGENPGIYLREREDTPWLALSVFFRVVLSPHGRGTGIVVLGAPGEARGFPDVPNLCVGDNDKLMRWLVAEFVSKFGAFRGMAGLGAMPYLKLARAETQAEGRRYYEETVAANNAEVRLRWENLGDPVAADVPVALSATQGHQMYSVFQSAERGTITINGNALPGRATMRDFLGRRMSTAFLAFSETWIRPAA